MEDSLQFDYAANVPLFCVCFAGVISHLLLLNAFVKDPLKCFRNFGTYLVANLAVSDFMVCLIAPFTTAMFMTRYHPFLEFFRFTFHLGSVITLALIAIERFVIVAYPFKHRLFMNGKVVSACLVCVWLLSCIHPAKELIFGFHDHDLILSVYFAVTLVILATVIYSFTYINLKKQSQNIDLQGATHASHAHTTRILKQKRFLRTIILIAFIYVMCSMPALIFSQVVIHLPYLRGDNYKVITILLLVLYQVNFAINPLIYFLRLPKYKKTFYLIYCKKGMHASDTESSSISERRLKNVQIHANEKH